MGVFAQDITIFEGTGFTLIGVDDDVFRAAVEIPLHEAPLGSGGSTATPFASQSTRFHGSDDAFRGAFGEGFDALVGTMLAGDVEGMALWEVKPAADDADIFDHNDPPLSIRVSRRVSTDPGVKCSCKVSLTCITGAVPHDPRHSTCVRVNCPSGVVSPTSIPRRSLR